MDPCRNDQHMPACFDYHNTLRNLYVPFKEGHCPGSEEAAGEKSSSVMELIEKLKAESVLFYHLNDWCEGKKEAWTAFIGGSECPLRCTMWPK